MLKITTHRSFFLLSITLFLNICCLFVSQSSIAQSYPSKAVKIIVPFAAGGPADNYARFIAIRLQDALKQAFVVEDRP